MPSNGEKESPRALIPLLLLCSGLCALVFQSVWMRELRHIFGASTPASAAVLGIFMAGLGVGGAVLGRRADRSANPLRLYALLEAGVALSVALTPLLVGAARAAYVAVFPAGSGSLWVTPSRLLLSALVLAVPTVLMGGTLPAAVRAFTRAADTQRLGVAQLYAVNTLGAVAGVLAATFFAVERLGARGTLYAACGLNLAVAAAALVASRRVGPAAPEAAASAESAKTPRLPLVASAVTGFVFFALELVWYRMLAPLLGGSTFTFGLILAVALLGIAAGAFVYARWPPRAPGDRTFATSCALFACCIVLPLGLGDSVALAAAYLRGLSVFGFSALAAGWALIAALVVFPAAAVSGYQLPLLVTLLGRGERAVGAHVGRLYAANTAGAILGCLVAGFGLLPLLGAVGAWRAAAVAMLALVPVWAWTGRAQSSRPPWPAAAAFAAAVALLLAPGPTAVWRHAAIGVGRFPLPQSAQQLEDLARVTRRTVVREWDGVESGIALIANTDLAFVINGKSDGAAIEDAPTQVMAGLVGAALLPAPRRALVIGLGTGSTAGWLARVPGMERVDVVEIEPSIVEVARAASAVNAGVLEAGNVRIFTADARELLLGSTERYDLIFSEPSNPYRAGISSLFTREFYELAKARLAPGGLMLQWVQAYEIDARAVRTIISTLGSVFPSVETWQTHPADLLLVAGAAPTRLDADALGGRLAAEPFKTALRVAWRTEEREGFLARFVAGDALSRRIVAQDRALVNTDDRNLLEFGLARSLTADGAFDVLQLRETAARSGAGRLQVARGEVDWQRVDLIASVQLAPVPLGAVPPQVRIHAAPLRAVHDGLLAAAAEQFLSEQFEPVGFDEHLALSEAFAELGHEQTLELLGPAEASAPLEAQVIRARLLAREGNAEEAAALLAQAFQAMRAEPWSDLRRMRRALDLAVSLAPSSPGTAAQLHDALAQPFAALALDEDRRWALTRVSEHADFAVLCPSVLAAWGASPPWTEPFLRYRSRCAEAARLPFAEAARGDLARFNAERAPGFSEGLLTADGAGSL